MFMKSIGEIKMQMQATDITDLPAFLEEYKADERDGVKKLLVAAQKKIDSLELEKKRIYMLSEFERRYSDYQFICGIDEVGRGPLAGPVVAGAVILPKEHDILYINDSKKLSYKMREQLYLEIKEKAIAAEVGIVDHTRIDEINILQATYEAMRLAISKLDPQPDLLLNDAVNIPLVKIRQIPIIKGDAKSISIGAASIFAKVTRDHMMEEYDALYPEYHFKDNMGYGTAVHIAALKEIGPCPIHRRSFIGNFLG